MIRKGLIGLLIWSVAIIFCTQYLVIAFVPKLLFAIAKYRSEKPMNTVIYAPKTDANFRRVLLPNPDFIYSACFYNTRDRDILITGEFTDSTQYCSLAFYGDNMQPYYVRNNQVGMKRKFKLRLSSVNRVNCDLITPTKEGAIVMRILAIDSGQMNKALALQKTLKIQELSQNE